MGVASTMGDRFTPISAPLVRSEPLPFGDGRCHVGLLEEEGACHEDVGAGFDADTGGIVVDPAVDGDGKFLSAILCPFRDEGDLGDAVGDEGLSAESGVDGHDEDEIGLIEERHEFLDGGLGVDGDPDLHSLLFYFLYRGMDVPFGFAMDGDRVASRVGEGVDVSDGVVDHQVGIEESVRVSSDGFDHRRSERYVGDEHPVHNIEVDPVRAGLVCPGDLLAESGEVCR